MDLTTAITIATDWYRDEYANPHLSYAETVLETREELHDELQHDEPNLGDDDANAAYLAILHADRADMAAALTTLIASTTGEGPRWPSVDGDYVPVSKPIPALTPSPDVERTLEQEFAAALGEMFPRDVHVITSADAYGALEYKVLDRCQETGETPTQVLASVSAGDRAFVSRANDPAAFLASRIYL
ncbi:hypothetical protein AB0F91_42585 [Amycolatopsis sp. NPDC023774]|uniref:hypothetical protein n=1 Tax=Amycolatopsis sp. NPDC023774 TaxID=3155015 RepID=UPI0033E52063